VCNELATSTWADCGEHKAVECVGCGFIWIEPMPSDKDIDKFYTSYDSLRRELGKDAADKRKLQYIMDRDFIYNFFIGKKNIKTLDFGCHNGLFLETFDNRFIKNGIEKNKGAVNWARENMSFGANIHACDIIDAPYEDEYFDLIVMRGVIEHLTHPNRDINKILRLLKSGGLLYVAATPNVGSFSAKKFRDKWNQLTVPGHLLYFSDFTLERYLNKFGFEMLAKYFPYIGTPYASPERDFADIQSACKSNLDKTVDAPFYNNLINAVFVKREK
jgi:SAM-dependent methyltransferase